MTCNLTCFRTAYLGGLLLLLGACEDTGTGGGSAEGGMAGTLVAAGAGGRLNSGGAGNGGANAGVAGSDAGPIDGGEGGSAGEPAAEGGNGGNGGATTSAGAGGVGAGGGVNGGSAGGGGDGVVREAMIPCDVYAAYSVCRNCHIDPPTDGAPMPLLTLEDLQNYADATYNAVQTGAMPAAGTLSARETELILGWLEAGAHGVPKAICP